VVGADSTILPGREGTVTAEIKTGNLHGTFKKTVTITSNATNDSSLKVSLSGKYATILEVVEPKTIRFSGAKENDTGAEVRIKSFRRFNVEKAEFKFNDAGAGMEWKTVFPIKYDMTLVDSTKTQNEKPDKKGKEEGIGKPFVYQVRLHLNADLKTDQWGEIYLTTNIKERKEIMLSGFIEAKR
jgi:hypothetical protein